MKMRFLRPYLDYIQGKDYIITPDSTAKYYISMRIAKEVTDLRGGTIKQKIKVEPKAKVKVEPKAKVKKAKVKKASINDPDDLLGIFD